MSEIKKRLNALNDHAYTKRTAALRKQQNPCHLCGKPIDYTLPYTHRMSFTADHITPRSKGGQLLGEIRAAHRSCNSRRGTKDLNTPKPVTTRNWIAK